MTKLFLKISFVLATISLFACSCTPEKPSPIHENALILMYHRIAEANPGKYDRTVEEFKNDLKYLQNNYQLISSSDLLHHINNQTLFDLPAVVITFDDAAISVYNYAFPILKEMNIPATVFIPTSRIGSEDYMSWEQLKEMQDYRNDKGEQLFFMESHSHTHTHLDPSKFCSQKEFQNFVNFEFKESKRIIKDKLNTEAGIFALPFGVGKENTVVVQAAKDNGYQLLRTSFAESVNILNPKMYDSGSLCIFDYSDIHLVDHFLMEK